MEQDKKEKFIELRAQGLSFDSIAKQLNISKPTALKLGLEFEQQVKRMQFVRLEALAEQYKLVKTARVEALAKLLEQVDSALKGADFKEMSPDRLVALKCKLMDRIQQEFTIRCDFDTVQCAPTDNEDGGCYILKVD